MPGKSILPFLGIRGYADRLPFFKILYLAVMGLLLLLNPAAGEYFTVEDAVKAVLEVNLNSKIAAENTQALQYLKDSRRTRLYPTFSTSYRLNRNDEEITSPLFGVYRPLNEYTFQATVRQPIFAGKSIINEFKRTGILLDASRFDEKSIRNALIYETRRAYFDILKAEKLLAVSQEAVRLLEAQQADAKNFYEVGMIPLNDLLKSEVELANSRLGLVSAQNRVALATAAFNTLLRRPVGSPVELEDIADYEALESDVNRCIQTARKYRNDLKSAEVTLLAAEKDVEISKQGFYPSIDLQGTYYRQGTDWDVDGGEGVLDEDGWQLAVIANWNFWEWGRTRYAVSEKLSRLNQAEYRKTALKERIELEVKQAFLKAAEAEKNILTSKTAIEQARENFRITQERFRQQMATTTDVLDASTLLSRTMTHYYTALYEYKISKAALSRAMGRDVAE